jgi:integrase
MRTFQTFLERPHNLKSTTIKSYKVAVLRWQKAAQKSFEETYLNEATVNKTLKFLEEKLEPSTWNTSLQRYKRLAKYLYDEKDEEVPVVWRQQKEKKIDWNLRLKEKFLTKAEFAKIIDACDDIRCKAFFGILAEAGLRSGEAGNMKIRDCENTSYGYLLTVSGKTGTRTVPIVQFAPALRQWLNFHPSKHDENAPLWTQKTVSGYKQKKLNSPTMNAILRKYCNRAGVYRWKTVVDKKTGETKKQNAITLHYLRHSKVTWTATNKLREVNIVLANDMFGWSKASTTYARYTHITGKDRVDAFLELAGSKKVERKEEEDALRLRKCLGCGMENSIGSLYCTACGCVLDEAQARVQVEKQKMMDWLMKKFMESQGDTKDI